MLKTTFIIVILLVSFALFSAAKDILGYWVTDEAASVVEIKEVDGVYEASIVALKEPVYTDASAGKVGAPKVDKFNPNEKFRNNPVLGLNIMQGFKHKKGTWKNGTIYDPKNGKTYKCKMTFNKKGNLDVRGYIGVPALGRTTEWMRPETYLKTTGSKSLGYLYPSPELKK